MNPLQAWYDAHTGRYSYKWSHYFDIYHRHLKPYRGKPVKVLEIGVWEGGSLQMFKDYFGKSATITGLDIRPEVLSYVEPRIKTIVGDQADPEVLKPLAKEHFDIVIDDGGHTMRQQGISFQELYKSVAPNGIYIVEDTHTSYMKDYVDAPLTFIDYTKSMIDLMHEHYTGKPYNDFAAMTDSITYYDSMIVFTKKPNTQPVPIETSNHV